MADASLHFRGAVGVPLADIGDELKGALGDAGKVIFSGPEAGGSRIDLRLDDRAPREKVLKLFRSVLTLLGVKDARIVVDGRESRFP